MNVSKSFKNTNLVVHNKNNKYYLTYQTGNIEKAGEAPGGSGG